jgi:LuxR family maltose regulon positive regulatory protein
MDDFHKAESMEILSSFNLFLDHLPPSLRIVMTVRQDPKLALARRRANGQLIEIQQHDLAFSSDECLRFLQDKLQTTISPAAAEHLTRATEGWITGIQLSAMSEQVIGSVPSDRNLNRDMSDYLFEEVFSLQPAHLQEFLLFTACVEKFCPALANDLMQINDSYHVIKELEAANLFIIALDNHRSWYRYHDLFRQFLLLHFHALKPKKKSELHQYAIHWFEEGGYYESAFQHAVILNDWDKCASLFALIAEEKIDIGLQQSLPNLLKVLPDDMSLALSKKYLELSTVLSTESIINKDLVEPLTKRESQVMALVKQGFNNKEIAEQLFISLNTLKVHIRNLYGKMGVENRTQALLKMNL